MHCVIIIIVSDSARAFLFAHTIYF